MLFRSGFMLPAAGGHAKVQLSASQRMSNQHARQQISRELGHERLKMMSIYLGTYGLSVISGVRLTGCQLFHCIVEVTFKQSILHNSVLFKFAIRMSLGKFRRNLAAVL